MNSVDLQRYPIYYLRYLDYRQNQKLKSSQLCF